MAKGKNDGAAFFCFQKQVWRIAFLKHTLTYKFIFEHENRLKMSTTFLQMKTCNRYVKTFYQTAGSEKNPFTLTRYGNYCNLIFLMVLFNSNKVIRIPNLAFCHSLTVSLRIEKKNPLLSSNPQILCFGEAKLSKKSCSNQA